ncbi:MAG TPA: cbb3-type cytochrome c oxidase subunit I [Candidatus Saccharimonadales bacterium]|nr:cbb3-type cytochrome c oxidase subunit I [Candidatus Saccharimonadales bacterium]
MEQFIFGRLTWSSLPHEWFTLGGTGAFIALGILVSAILTYFKRWKWIWGEWLTSTDPKKIGIMYMIVAFFMFLRGGLDAVMIWTQQVIGAGNAPGFLGATHGYLSADHFQQIFTAHGDIMVFFVTMGFLFGLINLIVPLQIGARDLAFPFLNSLGFWLYVAGVLLINMFFVLGGEFAPTGWLAVAPLSELQFNPGVGVDYWIWSLQVSGLGTLIGGINFVVTILKMRAPGMSLMRMPMFTWASLMGMILVISIFPILAMTMILLTMDRYLGMHFFTLDNGGNAMMYWNLIWMWGHPEVYVLIIPVFGIYSEIVSTFAQKKIFGYKSLIVAVGAITILSFSVWLHHFFTMGAGADINAFFGIMTMFIAIPTGVQIINWLFTLFRGRIIFKSPIYWFFGFVSTFTFGGMAGILMALPPVDFQIHNSLFLVAHFHTMIVGGALFGIFAGFTYWFPKVFGFRLNERIGKWAFWTWLVGFFVSFVPLYMLGMMGATRRLDHIDASNGWQYLFMVSLAGACIIMLAVGLQILQIIVSVIQRNKNRDLTGDPWNGRSLEWATSSPPPFYNFAVIPQVTSRDPFWEMKLTGKNKKPIKYEDIELPKNTPMAIYLAAFVFLFGTAMVFHAWLFAIIGLGGAIVCTLLRTFDEHTEYVLTAAEVEKIEKKLRHK